MATRPRRRILQWTRRLLFAAGVSLLAYCGFVQLDAWSFQNGARRQLEQLRADRQEANGGAGPAAFPASLATSPPVALAFRR